MSYFIFRQNNSGGYFTGPALYFIVSATDADTANSIAVSKGLYFDGKGDCECCGNRWYRVSPADAIAELPTTIISEHDKEFARANNVPALIII